VETDDMARLTAALQAACVALDALSREAQGPEGSPFSSTDPTAHASRYRQAVREAVLALERRRTSFTSEELSTLRRSLESLLIHVPR
jgi:hypothetical protein